MDITQQIKTRRQAAEDYLNKKRILWDNAEKLAHNQLNDAVSMTQKSNVFDPKLSTLTIERAYRVMAQLATGKVKAISKNDIGATMLMNLILDKYVIPNANSQFDFLTKLRMTDLYSNIYGCFFGLVDWIVKPNGYVGPDLWLLNIRDIFPQVGAVSLEDSDYVIVRSWRPLSFFENLKKDKSYTNTGAIVNLLKDKSGSKGNRDARNTSQRDQDQYPDGGTPAKGKGYFEVLSQYEGDRWVDFCVDADMIFRDQPNPHENGELPVVCKYSIPLLDDFMGMGDYERGGSMQMAINSNWNLYFDAVKMSIFPPVIINKDNVAAESTFKWGAAEKWIGRGNVGNIAQTLNLTPRGIETFNNTYQVANASLQNLFGTSNTDVSSSTDSTLGKTPQALEMQQQRENTRDNADRFYMEQFVESVMKKFANLISKKQKSAITMRLFDEDIQELKRSYPDIDNIYDEKTGKVTINSKLTGSTLYDYEVTSGSTFASDQKTQQQNLSSLVDMFVKLQTPQGNLLVDQLKQDGYEFNFGELMKKLISSSGIQDWDKILIEQTPSEHGAAIMDAHTQQFMQALQQSQGQGMNNVPPQPQQPPMPGQTPQSVPQQGQPQMSQQQPQLPGGING